MLATNELWARQHLVPMCKSAERNELQAVWHGLVFGSLNPEVAERLTDASLNVVLRIDDLFPNRKGVSGGYKHKYLFGIRTSSGPMV